jgi:hypothetical protein
MNTGLSLLVLVVLIVVLIIKDLKVVGMAKVKVE